MCFASSKLAYFGIPPNDAENMLLTTIGTSFPNLRKSVLL